MLSNFFYNLFFVVSVFAMGISTTASADCVSDKELVQLDIESQNSAKPCTLTGGTYLLGLGHHAKIDWIFDGPANKKNEFYWLVRQYLYNTKSYEGMPKEAQENFVLLVSALTSLPEGETEKEPIYKLFVLYENWLLNFDQSKHFNTRIRDRTGKLNEKALFKKTTELRCFILADIPEAPIEDVFKSFVFKDCIVWQKPIINQ